MSVAACGGGSNEPESSPSSSATGEEQTASTDANPEPLIVTSDDGALRLEIPAGAVPADTVITIAASAGQSRELSDLGDVLSAYELGPEGLAFDVPATVTFEVPATADRADGTPIVVGLLDSGGAVEPLRSQHLQRDETGLRLQGTLDHFSTVAFLDGLFTVFVSPTAPTVEVGSFFQSEVLLGTSDARASFPSARAGEAAVELASVAWTAGPGIDLRGGGLRGSSIGREDLECLEIVSSSYSIEIELSIRPDLPPEVTELIEASALGLVLSGEGIVDDPYAATLTEPVTCVSGGEPPPDTGSSSAADDPDESATDDPVDDPSASSDDDTSVFFIDDPTGDLVTLSGAPATPGTLPDVVDLIRFGHEGSLWSMTLAGTCDEACLAEMQIASCQLVVFDPEDRVTATAILQKNDEGGFDQRTDGDPALVVRDSSFTGDACEFDVDLSGLADECTVGGAVRGSRTDSIDGGAEDLTGTVPCR